MNFCQVTSFSKSRSFFRLEMIGEPEFKFGHSAQSKKKNKCLQFSLTNNIGRSDQFNSRIVEGKSFRPWLKGNEEMEESNGNMRRCGYIESYEGGKKSRRPVSAWNEDERVKEEGTTDRKVSLLYLPDTVCVRVRYVPLEQVHLLFFFFFLNGTT